ncbi:MAG: glycosyltransferase family 2 protein, partial [Candidatus Thorarchaeota archaeon]
MPDKKPKVSVLLITVRWGALEEQVQYLAQQTYPVDEFIVVDGFYKERHHRIKNLAEELGVNVIHLQEPKLSYQPFHNRCSNVNYAIAHAKYPLCVFIDDWHVIPNDFIETHVNLYNDGYAGIVRWIHALPIKLLTYENVVRQLSERNPTMEDARQHFMKTKRTPFTEERGMKWIDLHNEDERIKILNRLFDRDVRNYVITNIPVDWWWPNSASAPLKSLIAVNGFDETFNGGGGCEDVDIATRMSYIGQRYAMDTRVTCYHVNTDSVMVRRTDPPMCEYHDKSLFISDESLIENNQLTTWKVNGVRFCKCKICNATGVISSNELLDWKRKTREIQAPLESLGIQ